MDKEKDKAAGAVSIDTLKFRELLWDLLEAFRKGSRGGPAEPYVSGRVKLIDHINAHAAQRYEAGDEAGYARGFNHGQEKTDVMRQKWNAAESKLARLVEALTDIAQPANAGCGCHLPCRCATPEAERINAQEMREIAESALALLPAKAEAPTLICQRCDTDRLKAPCPISGDLCSVARADAHLFATPAPAMLAEQKPMDTDIAKIIADNAPNLYVEDPAPAMGEELPPPVATASKGAVAFFVKWTETGKPLQGVINLFTADQMHAYGRACMALRQPPIDRARVREVFMLYGFTVKEGQTDLKDYVYEAAEALLALRQPGAVEADAENDLPPLTMSVYGTRTALELERERRASVALRQPATPHDYKEIARLIGSIFYAGDFVAETQNERDLEALLIKTGHRYKNWGEVEHAALTATPAAPVSQPAAQEPVDGDILPPVGSTVQIHLSRPDAWIDHTVTGYYVWPDRGGTPALSRVFVRVADANGYENARLLCDVRHPTSPAPLSAPAGSERESRLPEVETRIGRVSNAYGGVYVSCCEGKFYWSVENYNGHGWEEIPGTLFNELLAFEALRRNS